MKNKIIITILIILVAALAALSSSESSSSIIPIKLKVGQDGYIVMDIPSKYIGPSKLSLANEVKEAKEPVGMIPLAFSYPNFEPWSSDDEENGQEQVFLMLSGGSGEKRGWNGFVYSRLGYRQKKICGSAPYPEKEFDMFRYKRFLACASPQKEHVYDLYFHDAPNGSEDDVLIQCPAPDRRKTEKCRLQMNIDQQGLVQTSLSVGFEFMPNWKQVVSDYKSFITPFYKNNIEAMVKPTQLSEERIKEIRAIEAEEWKPWQLPNKP